MVPRSSHVSLQAQAGLCKQTLAGELTRGEVTGSPERESAGQGHGHCFISWSGSDWGQLPVSGTDFFWGHSLQVPVNLQFHPCQKIWVHFELGENLFHIKTYDHLSWKRVHPPHTTHLQEIPVFLREAFLEEWGVPQTRCR